MRFGLVISGVAHAVVLVWTTLVFPSPEIFMVEPMRTLPVDIVSASELTRVRAGEKDAESAEPEEPAKQPPKQDKPATPPQRQAAVEPSRAEPAPKPSPPPTPPEPRSEPEPVPEPVVEPAPRPENEPEKPAAKEPPEERVEIDNAALQLPTFRPRAPKRQPEETQEFDPDEIAALLNKSPEPARRAANESESDQPATRGLASGRENTMSVSEIDLLRTQISRCWSPPIGVQGAADLAVRVRISLNPDGSLERPPETITRGSGGPFIAASDAARRAVIRCQPYNLPPDKYETWRDIHITFDPSLMLGG